MALSGLSTNVTRANPKTGQSVWVEVDLSELSSEEFLAWWNSTKDEKTRFVVAETFRRMLHQMSDFGDVEGTAF